MRPGATCKETHPARGGPQKTLPTQRNRPPGRSLCPFPLTRFTSCLAAMTTTPQSSRAPEPVGAYPYTRRVGDLLFLSGVGPRQRGQHGIAGVEIDEDGNILHYDFESQCHAVFQNVRYILEEAGASWEDLVDVTVFLTNMKDDFPVYNRLYADYFGRALPCRTTLEINALPTPIAIELKCIAFLGPKAPGQ